MSFSGFGRNKEDVGVPPAPAATGSAMSNLTAFIDQGSEFEGKLSFKDTVRIDGCFRGEISSENTLIVGEPGEIMASIHSTTVVISGLVVGDVTATRQVVLHKTARLQGDVVTPSLVMEEGAVLNGGVKMERPQPAGGNGDKKEKSGSPKNGNSNKNS